MDVIGGVVAAAARLEALTKEVSYPVLCSAPVASAVAGAGGLRELGGATTDGGPLWGWAPPLTAAAVAKS